MRVLLVEDDSATAQSMELMLKSENFNVYTTDSGEEAIDLGKLYDYDIILLDLNLPDMSGYEVLRTLRVAKVKTPIMIVSGLAGIQDKVKGLGFGADDYLTKPFHKDEMVARLHAIVRRSKGHAQSVITTGDLVVNLDEKTVSIAGARVYLTGKEYQMLELLSLRKGTTLSKNMFLSHLYGGIDEPELKIIDVFICKLRKKLADASRSQAYPDGLVFIETVWGKGCRLVDPAIVRGNDSKIENEGAGPAQAEAMRVLFNREGLDIRANAVSCRAAFNGTAIADINTPQLAAVAATLGEYGLRKVDAQLMRYAVRLATGDEIDERGAQSYETQARAALRRAGVPIGFGL